jgi:hypothetical protein
MHHLDESAQQFARTTRRCAHARTWPYALTPCELIAGVISAEWLGGRSGRPAGERAAREDGQPQDRLPLKVTQVTNCGESCAASLSRGVTIFLFR